MTTDIREGLALALVNSDRARRNWPAARWKDFDESTQRDYLANADCALAFIRAHLADAVAFVRKAGHLPGCAAGTDSCQFSTGKQAMKCGAIKGAWWHNRNHKHFGHDFQPGKCTCGHDRIVGSEG